MFKSKFWRQFAIDQLDFGFWSNVPQEVSDFIPGSLKDTDKHIDVTNRHHMTAKKKDKYKKKCSTIMEILSS